jgi:hypothetical protein
MVRQAINIVCIILNLVAVHGYDNTRNFYFRIGDIGPTHGETSDSPQTKWLLSKSWKNNVAISVDPNKPNVPYQDISHVKEATENMGLSVVLTSFASSFREKYENVTTNLSRAVNVIPPNTTIVWEYICEDDSAGTGFSQILLGLARSLNYTNGRSRLNPSEAYAAWKEYIVEAYNRTVPFDRLFERHARIGFPSNAHSVAMVSDVVLVERANDDVGSYATSIPFVRGAARQFRKRWGMDLSLWWGVIDGCVGSQYPGKLHERMLFASYISGASVVAMEGVPWLNSTSHEPFPISNVMDKFGTYFSKQLKPEERGIPDVSIAMVMTEHHGWSETPSWGNGGAASSWNYANLATNSNVKFANAIFQDVFFPGSGSAFSYFAFPFGKIKRNLNPPPSPFARSSITEKYAPNIFDVHFANSDLDVGHFENRDDIKTWFQESRADPSLYRPEADSRYGDILDILVGGKDGDENLLRTIGNYDIVLWNNETLSQSARVAITNNLTSTIFIIFAGSFGDEIDDIVKLSGETRAVRSWEGFSDEFNREALVIAHTSLVSEGVEIVARSCPEGYPILLKKENVYVSLEIRRGVSMLTKGLLNRVVNPVVKLIGEKLPPLYYASTRSSDGNTRVLVLVNNANAPWQGRVSVDISDLLGGNTCSCRRTTMTTTVRDHLNSSCSSFDVVEEEGAIVLSERIDAFGTVLVRVSCGGSD